MPDYRAVLDETQSAIGRRAKNFRNQIVAVVLVGVISVLSALLTRSFAPLLGIIAIVPVVGFFFFADARILDGWRSALLASWVEREIDFFAFRNAIRANPALPKGTTEAMLATLPSSGTLIEEQRLSTAARQEMAAQVRTTCRARTNRVALKAAVSAIVTIAILAGAALTTARC